MKKIFLTGFDADIEKAFISIGLAISLSKIKKYLKHFQSGVFYEKGTLKAY